MFWTQNSAGNRLNFLKWFFDIYRDIVIAVLTKNELPIVITVLIFRFVKLDEHYAHIKKVYQLATIDALFVKNVIYLKNNLTRLRN